MSRTAEISRSTGETDITARSTADNHAVAVRYEIDADGRIRSSVFDRWGDPDNTGRWEPHPFGGTVSAYRTFDGVTIPSAGTLGWYYGTDRWPEGEFFRYEITALHLEC